MEKKIQGIPYSYDEIIDELTAYIEERLNFWNNYVVDEDEQIELIDVQLHGSRLRGQAKENSDLDCVFEYSGPAREDTLFNFMNYDEDEEPYTICGISVDFNPINAEETNNMEEYMAKSNEYDKKMLSIERSQLEEAVQILTDNGYIVEGIFGKALATGALAASMAMANSNVKAHPVTDPNLNFGKNTEVHIQDRYDLKSDRFGIPKEYKLQSGEDLNVIDIVDEIALTKTKILSTPDSIFREYGKKHIDTIARLITNAANKYNIDVDILLAIACVESNFDNTSVSGKNAKGIMQMTKIAASDVHSRISGLDSTKFDFKTFEGLEKNIYSAAKLISDISVRRNNIIEMVFATYNGGTAAATELRKYYKGEKNKLPTETKNYVKDCIKMYKYYKKIGEKG